MYELERRVLIDAIVIARDIRCSWFKLEPATTTQVDELTLWATRTSDVDFIKAQDKYLFNDALLREVYRNLIVNYPMDKPRKVS